MSTSLGRSPESDSKPHFDRELDTLEADLVGQLHAAADQFGADAGVLKGRADDHQDLAHQVVGGEQGHVAHHAFAEREGHQVDPVADHVLDPLDAGLVLDRRKALEGTPRLVGQIHLDQALAAFVVQGGNEDRLALAVDEGVGEAVDRALFQPAAHRNGTLPAEGSRFKAQGSRFKYQGHRPMEWVVGH
jgi:hypothetical protein